MFDFSQDGRFTVLNSEGKEVECEILFTFDSDDSSKSYIVYTDNTVDEEGNTNVYASWIDSNDGNLHEIDCEDEWKSIESILSVIQDQSDKKTYDITQCINEMTEKIEYADSVELRNCVNAIESMILDEENANYLQELFDLLRAANAKLGFVGFFVNLGMQAYEKGFFELAELAFCEADAKNNLAYMIRRKEVKDFLKYSNKNIAELLQEGVHQKEPFSMINMSLLWAINIGTEDAWKLADDIMSNIPKDNIMSALRWWYDVAKKGDVEGYLVHYWMLRHGKIDKTPLGTKSELIERLSADISGIPYFLLY